MPLWFGKSWGAPVNTDEDHTAVPVGEPCIECNISINMNDNGFLIPFASTPPTLNAYHRVCFLRTVIPCNMWDDDLLSNMPERWHKHREEHHPTVPAITVSPDATNNTFTDCYFTGQK